MVILIAKGTKKHGIAIRSTICFKTVLFSVLPTVQLTSNTTYILYCLFTFTPRSSVADPDRFGPDPDPNPTNENRSDPDSDPDPVKTGSGSGFI